MVYVMSDIHGHYDKYIEALNRINFTKEDTLYIIGDMLDRGEDGIKILQDIMGKENIVPLLGNHEYMALQIFKVLIKEITTETLSEVSEEFLASFSDWIVDGGEPTLASFCKLSVHERLEIIDFIESFEVYHELIVHNTTYFLVHAGIDNFNEQKELSKYYLHEFIFGRTDYHSIYFKDKILVTGHTPTRWISNTDTVFRGNNHLAIDCGCGFGGTLGVVCLDNDDAYYI